VGIKDIPFFDGLRSIFQKQRPVSRESHNPYDPNAAVVGGLEVFNATVGDLGLVGNAAKALPVLRKRFPGLQMLGRGNRPDNPNSDHPLGNAIDVMTGDETTAQQIITVFKGLSGAKYWIWKRRIGNITHLWVPGSYTGPNPHTDHVHLSFF